MTAAAPPRRRAGHPAGRRSAAAGPGGRRRLADPLGQHRPQASSQRGSTAVGGPRSACPRARPRRLPGRRVAQRRTVRRRRPARCLGLSRSAQRPAGSYSGAGSPGRAASAYPDSVTGQHLPDMTGALGHYRLLAGGRPASSGPAGAGGLPAPPAERHGPADRPCRRPPRPGRPERAHGALELGRPRRPRRRRRTASPGRRQPPRSRCRSRPRPDHAVPAQRPSQVGDQVAGPQQVQTTGRTSAGWAPLTRRSTPVTGDAALPRFQDRGNEPLVDQRRAAR